jgi:DNA-binding MarR family transcriptional regulator
MRGATPSRSDRPALEAHLGYLLRRVSNHVSGAFAKALDAKQVSVAEWVVLSEIHQHPEIRPAELADKIGLTRGATSKVLDKLEQKKWIRRKTFEADSRGQLLFLTQQGSRVLPELKEIADRNDQRFFDCLDARETTTLKQLLRKLTTSNEIRDVPLE